MSRRIMIIAGEASGDLHGGMLVKALLALDKNLEIFGMGGDQMQQAGMHLYYHVNQLAFIGFTEVIRHLGFFKKIFSHLFNELERRKPDLVILIDYPGFNLRFAKKAKKAGFKTFYYIAPQVWAWGQGRASQMAHYIDQMAVIFDFEEPFFKKFNNSATFVGHPLLDILHIEKSQKSFCSEYRLDPARPMLALLPGSREQEVHKLLPTMLQTAGALKSLHPELQVTVSQAPTILKSQIDNLLTGYEHVTIIDHSTCEHMKYATAAMVASGTATLEMAMMETPFIVAYKVSPLSYTIMKHLIQIPNIGLVNVVGGEEMVPEFIQNRFKVKYLMPVMENLLFDQKIRGEIKNKLKTIRPRLGHSGAAMRTAELAMLCAEK